MRNWKIFVMLGLVLLWMNGCKNFDGIAGDPAEANTSNYNVPNERVIPYNNPYMEDRDVQDRIDEVCKGVTNREDGFKCKK